MPDIAQFFFKRLSIYLTLKSFNTVPWFYSFSRAHFQPLPPHWTASSIPYVPCSGALKKHSDAIEPVNNTKFALEKRFILDYGRNYTASSTRHTPLHTYKRIDSIWNALDEKTNIRQYEASALGFYAVKALFLKFVNKYVRLNRLILKNSIVSLVRSHLLTYTSIVYIYKYRICTFVCHTYCAIYHIYIIYVCVCVPV